MKHNDYLGCLEGIRKMGSVLFSRFVLRVEDRELDRGIVEVDVKNKVDPKVYTLPASWLENMNPSQIFGGRFKYDE